MLMPIEAAEAAEKAIKAYVDACGCKTPDDVRKGLELLMSKSARAIEKYSGHSTSVLVCQRTEAHVRLNPVPVPMRAIQ